jgi:capsular polysaccharide biosynthesis protein
LLPADLIPGESHDQYTLFQRFFRYVARGGAYVLDRTTATTPSALMGMERWTRLLAASEDGELAAGLPRRDVDLAESTGTVLLSRDLIVATKRFDHLVKLREADVEPVLGPREPDLTMTVLSRRRAREFTSRATVTSHGDLVPHESFPQKFTIPALSLRRYEGKIGSPGGTLLFTGRSVLPDSFRWHMAANPKNVRLVASVAGFSRLESRYVPRRRLAGNYYSLDSSHSGHFGHLTTEVVARLWGWDRAKQEMPDLKALFHLKPGTKRHPQLEIDLLTAYGIPEEDIVWVNEPVWLDSVASSTPMWHNEDPHYVDPDIVSTWDRLTDGLLARAPAVEPHQRLFISRRVSNRTCRNRAAVEEFFTSRGYHVVFPEVLSLPEQVALFSQARVIAGFAGSNMFNLMHARKLEATIVLSHDGYIARNEHLFSAVRGGESHYFWSRASIPQPDGGYSKQAFHSEWQFDFDANGKELDEVVTRLG